MMRTSLEIMLSLIRMTSEKMIEKMGLMLLIPKNVKFETHCL